MDNKRRLVGVALTAIMVISVFVALTMPVYAAEEDITTLGKIQKAIDETGAKWTAGTTSVSGLSIEAKKMLCGAKIGPIHENAVKISPPPNVSMPTGTFDWRNVDGKNWMTSVKNQGSCGSCWIFGSTAAFEAQINIDAHDSTIDFDSSEQHILSCSGGGNCKGGDPALALSYINDSGVPDETCFPYQADDTIPCSDTCSDWENRACTFEWIGVPTSHTTGDYKWILENYGPMVVVLNVSEDLFYYTGGIYEPAWTSEEFGWADHCVALVGYNDTEEYWVIKNSWGPSWGEEGYGRVYYGDLEQYEYAFVTVNTTYPISPDIWVDPTSFDVTLPRDTIYSTTLTIGNDGDGTLTFEITDTEGGGVTSAQEPVAKSEFSGLGLEDLAKEVEGTIGADNVVQSLEVASGEHEIAYDDGEIDYAHWWDGPGGASGVHFTSPTYNTLTTIRFYIYSNLTAFDWKVLSWPWSQPGSVIASGTTTPTSSGWHDVDVGGISVPSDFVIAIYWKEANQPTLGSDGDPPIDDRSWDFNGVTWSSENMVDYMIRAVMSTEEGWLSESPTSGTVESMSQTNITVTFNTTGLSVDDYHANITITNNDPDENPVIIPVHLTVTPSEELAFDTGKGTYPSISGTHNGTIRPNKTINVHKLYTYSCTGTGGHSESVHIWGDSINKSASWTGYSGDWHNITFSEPFVLYKNETYNYTIITGSYPQIHHTPALPTANGWINCTSFVDANGKDYNNWIPAIRLE